MTALTLCCNTVGLSSRVGGWGGRKRASFLELSDFVEITHPFHPFRGQRHPRIASKKWAQRDHLSLAVVGRGTLCVPREWTDQADPVAYSSHGPLFLLYERLVELADFLPHLRKKTEE
jgi:uncharacterized protein DUF5372